jgi:PEP-CTERM motif
VVAVVSDINEDFFSIIVPAGYVSGAPLADSSTYLFETLPALGARPGEFVWSWGSGVHADSFVIEIGGVFPAPVPEPSTWAMMLIGLAGFGFAAVRRKRAFPAI